VLSRLRRRLAQRHAAMALARAAKRRLPPGARKADVQEVLRLARLSLVQMQAAWDRADLQAIGGMAMAPLLDDLRGQLAERGPSPNHTEVLQLDARLLSLEDLAEAYVASVEFTGYIREESAAPASPFRELWLLANVKSAERGWQLAQVQSLS
jgi:predicted lipid-binding transport protein (Tim44 family)